MKTLEPVNSHYLLQVGIEYLYHETLSWKSDIEFFQYELNFFQTILDKTVSRAEDRDSRINLEHLQNKVTYYKDEVALQIRKDVKQHDKYLKALEENESGISDQDYRNAHLKIKDEVESFANQFRELKKEIYSFFTHIM